MNPSFVPDLEPIAQVEIPPWLAEAELDTAMVAPSQQAQAALPWTHNSLHRLVPLRISTHSTQSSTEGDGQAAPQRDDGQLPPPPPRDSEHM